MRFEANRDMKVDAVQGDDGLFTLRSKGLALRRRPELEIVAVPEGALRAAGAVINQVAEYTVNTAEVFAAQRIGLTLGNEEDEDDDGDLLMLALRAIVVEAPKTGLFARLGGGGKGVLRLVDIMAEDGGAPLTALSTMLVHRARVRLAGDDVDGAREELETAIEIFPGEEHTGSGPVIGDGKATFNWQNHLAYLTLAELEADAGDEDEAATLFGQALARSDELALAEIGAPVRELTNTDERELERVAARIVEHNLSRDPRFGGAPAPSAAHAVLVSPLWEHVGDGEIGRRASLVPAGFRELYYEGAGARGLRSAGARIAANGLRDALGDPARLAWSMRDVRGLWKDDHAPLVETLGDLHPAHGLLSTLLVFVGRCFRAGATEAQIVAGLAGTDDDALARLLAAESEWERAQYDAALSMDES